MTVASISLRFEEFRDNGYLTHNLHPYPAKFVPQIPREIISQVTSPGDWVLDPFCGSGTTLVECALLDRSSVGTDVNPLACKIAAAKATRLSVEQLERLAMYEERISRATKLGVSAEPPRFQGIDKWFQPAVQQDLADLLEFVRSESDSVVRNFLEVVFSAIVVRVSNQESDTRYKAIEKDLPPGTVRKVFSARLTDAVSRAKAFATESTARNSLVFHLDSTNDTAPVKSKFKLAVTSPPYMNSYDYYLYHKHRMRWLGLDVASTQQQEFGSRNKHNDRGLGPDAYYESVLRSISLTRRQLADDGVYCVVVGDAIWRQELYQMNTHYDALFSKAGYIKLHEITFPQRTYTRSFTKNLRTQAKNSYVLLYAKG